MKVQPLLSIDSISRTTQNPPNDITPELIITALAYDVADKLVGVSYANEGGFISGNRAYVYTTLNNFNTVCSSSSSSVSSVSSSSAVSSNSSLTSSFSNSSALTSSVSSLVSSTSSISSSSNSINPSSSISSIISSTPATYSSTVSQTLNINGNNSGITSSNVLPAGTYRITVSNTYNFAGGHPADAGYSLRPKGENDKFGVPYPVATWVSGDDLPGGYKEMLKVKIDGQNINWGPYNSAHIYSTDIVKTDGNPFAFSIIDAGYGDNSGSLQVQITKI